MQAAAPADAVVASNTSALSVTEMAAVLDCPGRMGGMHFFVPSTACGLVEIVRALETSEATVATLTAVAVAIGKETVLVRESPGFVTSRINAMIGSEAFYMLQEGVASARDIDKALQLNEPSDGCAAPNSSTSLASTPRLSILRHLHHTLGEVPPLPPARAARGGRPPGTVPARASTY
ncbi:MAG: 3-hydroxyacyl-CoA dehydrogenase NAD-binding domain-containing protein [Vicinamibacterales bacterium]